jgi:hypothetical protein
MLDQMPTDKARSAENRDLRHHLAKSQNMASRLLPLQSLCLLHTMFIASKVQKWHIPEEAHWSAHEPVNGPSFDQLFVAP